jgi:PAS domain S-box-containing protein
MHALLYRQLERALGKLLAPSVRTSAEQLAGDPASIEAVLLRVDDAYAQADRDQTLLRRSLEISSEELTEANERLRGELDCQREAVRSLEQALEDIGAGESGKADIEALARRMVDATQRLVHTQQLLQISEQRFELAMRGANDGLWDYDSQTGTVFYSPRWSEMLGLEPEQVGDSPEELLGRLHPEDHLAARTRIEQALNGQIPGIELTYRCRKAEGGFIWVLARAITVRDAEGVVTRLIGTHTDITALKESELELARARDAAEAASRAKSEFLASMSHELRTPLHAVLGYTQLLSADAGIQGAGKQLVAEIARAGQHLMLLLDDLIDMARIESGELNLKLALVDVGKVLVDSLAVLSSNARERDVQLPDERELPLGVLVRADPGRLRQVVVNLLSNAIKYNRPGGKVRLEMRCEAGEVRVTVIDTGIGIPAERQHRVFSAFDRLGAERGNIEGTGVGLVITRRLVEAMAGSVGFHSEQGVGSRFWFVLPFAEAASEPTAAEAEANGSPLRHVLYIEDNPVNIRLMRQIVKRLPATRLSVAENAAQGVSLASMDPPQLVLLGLNLPGEEGFDCLARLRDTAELPRVPVIAVTASVSDEVRVRAEATGFAAVVTKPFPVQAMIDLISGYLESGAGSGRAEESLS